MPAYARTALSTAFPIIHSLPSLAADKIPELSAAGPAAAPLGSPAEIFRAISFAPTNTPGAYRSAAKLPPRMSPIAQIATVLPFIVSLSVVEPVQAEIQTWSIPRVPIPALQTQ